MARPTKYSPNIVAKICALIEADTYTVAEVCRMVKIGRSTYFDWLNKHLEFLDAIKKSEETRNDFFVAEAKKSLLKKIKGYTIQEKHITTTGSGKYDVNGKEIPKIKEQKIIDKYFQPDTAAIIFTLTNTDPENWKDRKSLGLTGKDGKELVPARVLTKAEAKEFFGNNGKSKEPYENLTDEELDKLLELKRKTIPSINELH